jgi:DNA-directed RNA polymerase specialized sigma24 family protein
MAAHGLNTVVRHLRQLVAPRPGSGGDRDLLDRYVTAGDQAAFAELVKRHGPLVLGVARRTLGDPHSADGVFQATLAPLLRYYCEGQTQDETACRLGWSIGPVRRCRPGPSSA